MKFKIETTSTAECLNDLVKDELKEAGFILKRKLIREGFFEYFVEISSIEQLIKFQNAVGEALILRPDDEYKVIEIYDTWREGWVLS